MSFFFSFHYHIKIIDLFFSPERYDLREKSVHVLLLLILLEYGISF